MLRYENKAFRQGELPDVVSEVVFVNCRFNGSLPCFRHCEFHNCDLSDTKVFTFTSCKLFSCNLSRADFSKADVRFSITNAGSPCLARRCKWDGIIAQMDCSFFSGLKVSTEDAELFLVMALIPDYEGKEELYRLLPLKTRKRARQLLSKDFRHE